MILLVGPSAVGKTEVGKALNRQFQYKKMITYTTRAPRINEIQDVDYHFVSVSEFLNKQENKFFFETVFYATCYYGTALEDIDPSKYVIVEPVGLKHYKDSDLFCVAFYLDAKDETRKQRMILRHDSEESIQKRMELDSKHFSQEIKEICDFTIEVDNKTVEEIAKEINELYKIKKK